MFHYARLTQDFEHSEVEGPEVFHFVSVNGEDDWVEVQPREPLGPQHESLVRDLVREHTAEAWSCDGCGASGPMGESVQHEADCEGGEVSGTAPLRITRRFLRLQGADFVTIGDDS